jgi:hypothetical protein
MKNKYTKSFGEGRSDRQKGARDKSRESLLNFIPHALTGGMLGLAPPSGPTKRDQSYRAGYKKG